MIKPVLCLLLLVLSAAGLHPLHVSVTEINYDEKDRALEMMVRIFADDLETTLRKRYNEPTLDILNPGSRSVDQMMTEYLTEKVSVAVDGKRQTLKYLGNERDGDAFIFYVEIPRVKKWKTIAVANSVLTEVFDDQSNLVHVTNGGTVRSLRLNKGNPEGNLSFGD